MGTYNDRYPSNQSPYAQGNTSPYARGGTSPYARKSASPYSNGGTSPYDCDDDSPSETAGASRANARTGRTVSSRTGRAANARTSRTVNRPTGVKPVTAGDYERGTLGYSYPDSSGKPKGTSRRGFIAGAALAGAAALLAVGGGLWWTHRAVTCEINGSKRTITINSTTQDIIDKGYANPAFGNLISIPDADGNVVTLTQGGGNSYTLTVNGEEVDPTAYRAQEGDTLVFANGTDVTEGVIYDDTIIPCGLQYTEDGIYLATIGYVQQWGKNGISRVETGEVSNRRTDLGIIQETQDLIVTYGGINPDDGRMLVALTFDDGPATTYTQKYLDILAAYGVRATFYMLGENVDMYPDLARAVYEAGHQIGSHTYGHVNLLAQDDATVASEIDRSFTSIENAVGAKPSSIRPPYGNFYGRNYVKNLGKFCYTAYWSVDSEDWELPGSDAIVQNCTKNLQGNNYNGAVILMHDGGGDRSQDVAALPYIIETFMAAGYQLVTMDELIGADSTIPAWVSGGDASIPADSDLPDLSVVG